jgi:hypothetical protein
MNDIKSNLSETTFGVYIGQSHLLALQVTMVCLSKFGSEFKKIGAECKTFIVDNASGHREFLLEYDIPFYGFDNKKRKKDILNWMLKNCNTKYLVLLESDVFFTTQLLDLQVVEALHGQIMSQQEMANQMPFIPLSDHKDCISTGIIVLDMELLRSKGIDCFDDENDRGLGFYYNGAWLLEKLKKVNLSYKDFNKSSELFDPDSAFSNFGLCDDSDESEPKTIDAQLQQKLQAEAQESWSDGDKKVTSLSLNYKLEKGVLTQTPLTHQFVETKPPVVEQSGDLLSTK